MKRYAIAAAAILVAACSGREDGVDLATAETALAAMALEESGSGMAVYESRSFDNGVYTFTGVTLTAPESDDEDEIDLELEFDVESETSGVDMDEAETADFDMDDVVRAERMVLANPQIGEDGAVSFERLALEGIGRLDDTDSETRFSISSVVIERPNAVLAADIARAFARTPNENPDWRSYGFGLVAIEGLSAVTPPTDGQSGGGVAQIDRFALSEYDTRSLGRFEITGLRITGEEPETGTIHVALDEFSVDGMGPALFQTVWGSIDLMTALMETGEAPALATPDDGDPFDVFDRILMTGLDLNFGGVLVTMDRAELVIDECRNGDVHMTTFMSPLVITADAEQSIGAAFAMGLNLMGYEQLEFTSRSEGVYDRASDRMYSTGRDYLEMTDGLRIETEYDFGGYLEYMRGAMAAQTATMEAQFSGDEEAINAMMAEVYAPLILNRFVMRIEDRSLLERALNAASAAQGLSASELRSQAALMIAFGLAGLPAEFPRPLIAETAEALTAFINEGGTLVITMTPPVPVSMGEIMAQAEAGGIDLAALGMSITAEAPAQ